MPTRSPKGLRPVESVVHGHSQYQCAFLSMPAPAGPTSRRRRQTKRCLRCFTLTTNNLCRQRRGSHRAQTRAVSRIRGTRSVRASGNHCQQPFIAASLSFAKMRGFELVYRLINRARPRLLSTRQCPYPG